MIYCISDVHGEQDRLNKMLELIQFSDTDTLYFLGDAIDRKSHGIEVLQDIMRRPNVHMILGNHEQMMLDSFWSNNTYDARRLWKNNGGGSTIMQWFTRFRQKNGCGFSDIFRSCPTI